MDGPKAYVVAEFRVTDGDAYKAYAMAAADVVSRFQGRFLIRGGDPELMEGDGEAGRIVLIEFPSRAVAEAFYGSQEYQDVRALRADAARVRYVVASGA